MRKSDSPADPIPALRRVSARAKAKADAWDHVAAGLETWLREGMKGLDDPAARKAFERSVLPKIRRQGPLIRARARRLVAKRLEPRKVAP